MRSQIHVSRCAALGPARRAAVILAAAVAAGLLSASAAWAAPGDLDTSFGNNGVALTSVGTNGGDGADQMVRQSDGKLVVVGTGRDASGNLVVQLARYTPNGSLDSTFGNNGLVTLPEHGGQALFGPTVSLQSSTGDILVAGSWGNPSNFNTLPGDFGAERVTSTGTVDSTFGSSGFVDTQLGVAASDVAGAVSVNPTSGEIYLGGSATPSAGAPTDMAVAAYSASGTLDTSFAGGTGKVLTPISGGGATINALALDGSSIVAAGSFFNTTTGNPSIAVMRYTSAGSPDSTFNSGAPSTFNVGSDSYAHSVLVQSNHKIVVGGVGGYGSVFCMVLGRLNSDGSRDTGFGSSGDAHACFGSSSGDDSEVYGLASDGTYIYAAGNSFINSTTQNHVALARFSANGVLDTGFGKSGLVTSDPAGSSNQSNANSIVLDGGNDPVIAGQAFNLGTGTTYFALERFLGGSTPTVAPTNTSAPYYFGTYDPEHHYALPGKTIWGDAGGWTASPTHYAFEWLLCPSKTSMQGCAVEQNDDVPASGSGHTVDSYTVPVAGERSYLRLEIKAVNSAGYNNPAFAPPLYVATPPSNTKQPTVSLNGPTPWPKETFTATSGTWSGTQPLSYEYTWLRCSSKGYPCDKTPAQSGGSKSYVIQAADVGHRMLLEVSATNSAGSVTTTAPSFTGTVQAPGPPKLDASYLPDPSNWFNSIDFSSGKHPTFTVGDEVSASGSCTDDGSGVSQCEFIDLFNGKDDQIIPAQDSASGVGAAFSRIGTADFSAAGVGWHTLGLWANDSAQSRAVHTDLTYKVVAPPSPKQQVAQNHSAVGAGPTVLDPLLCEFNATTCHLIYSGSTPVGEVQTDILGKSAELFSLNNAQVIAAGNGNVIAAGNGNVIIAGSGNVIAPGAGNLFELNYGGRVICAGSGNVISNSSGSLVAKLISDKGLGIISDKGLGLISDKGLGLISDKGLGLVGNDAQLIMATGAQLAISSDATMQLASQLAFASGGIFSGVVSNASAAAADVASAVSARKHRRSLRLGSGSSVVLRHGKRGHLTLLFNKRGSALIAKLARINAQRKRHHKRLRKLTLRITTKFKPATGARTVTRTRTIKITPLAPPKKKKR